jgi:two-component system chemotaxis response regulator CheY
MADVDLLKACLGFSGASTTVARNPFTALDRVRAEEPDLVVSDLDLWANDGALLLQRLRCLSRAPPLLFLADPTRSAGLEERARRAGAAGVLLRPLRPGEVEDRLGDLLRARDGGLVGRPPTEGVAGGADQEGAPTAMSPAEPPAEPGSAELAWLRFLHGASRLARLEAPKADRARAFARRALQDLHARAAAIVYREGGGAAAATRGGGADAEGLPDLLQPAPMSPRPSYVPGKRIRR